jgi:hypothetical protein
MQPCLAHVQDTSLGMQCLPCYPPLSKGGIGARPWPTRSLVSALAQLYWPFTPIAVNAFLGQARTSAPGQPSGKEATSPLGVIKVVI